MEKYRTSEARRKISFAEYRIPLEILKEPKRNFEKSASKYSAITDYIKEAIEHNSREIQGEDYATWNKLLCEASFGKGLVEGLLEMKLKTYKTRSRSLQELELVTIDFNEACADLITKPQDPNNHSRMGKSFGRLGLAKEGKKMLEVETYCGGEN